MVETFCIAGCSAYSGRTVKLTVRLGNCIYYRKIVSPCHSSSTQKNWDDKIRRKKGLESMLQGMLVGWGGVGWMDEKGACLCLPPQHLVRKWTQNTVQKNSVAGFMNPSTKILYCVRSSRGSLFIKPNKAVWCCRICAPRTAANTQRRITLAHAILYRNLIPLIPFPITKELIYRR